MNTKERRLWKERKPQWVMYDQFTRDTSDKIKAGVAQGHWSESLCKQWAAQDQSLGTTYVKHIGKSFVEVIEGRGSYLKYLAWKYMLVCQEDWTKHETFSGNMQLCGLHYLEKAQTQSRGNCWKWQHKGIVQFQQPEWPRDWSKITGHCRGS